MWVAILEGIILKRLTAEERNRLVEFARMNPNAPLPSEAKSRRLTLKQERFCQYLAMGAPLVEAYRKAYPGVNYGNEMAEYSEAYRLSVKPHIAHRVAELVQINERENSALKTTRATRVLNILEKIMVEAKTDRDKIRAAELLGKASGIFEKPESDKTKANSLEELEAQLTALLSKAKK